MYKVVRVTGPHHNLLGIALADGPRGYATTVEALPCLEGEPVRLSAEEVQRQVSQGVAEANAASGTAYECVKIQFVPSDTPPPTVYKLLASAIVRRLAKGETFRELIARS